MRSGPLRVGVVSGVVGQRLPGDEVPALHGTCPTCAAAAAPDGYAGGRFSWSSDDGQPARYHGGNADGVLGYARIRRHAFVTLTNHRSEPAVARVTLSLVGQAEGPSDEGRVRLEIADDVNSRSEVRWDLTLAPGASKTVECDLSFFVR